MTGVVVREGGSVPDISTPEAFKQAPLNARSVAYTDPKAGGSGGIMFSALLEKHGIAEAINKKAVLGKSGHDVTTSIAEGRAEIGTTFISEVPEALLRKLSDPTTRPRWIAAGLEPAFPDR
ncbi:MAG: substrate-binding domain-containing protein [Pseudolabrys sp.]